MRDRQSHACRRAAPEEPAPAVDDALGDESPCCEEHGVEAEEVVEAIGDGDPHEEHADRERDREGPVGAEAAVVPQRPHARQPHGREQEARCEQRDEGELDRRAEPRMFGVQVGVHRDRRPRTRHLPDQVRSHARQRECDTRPQPAAREHRALAVDKEAHGESEEQERNRLLGLHPEPDGHPDRHPEAAIAGAEDAQHQPGGQRPHQHVVHGRAFEVAHDEQSAGRDARGREPLREPRAAELARHQAGEDHDRADDERGKQAEPEQGVIECDPIEPGDQHRYRRLIHVAEREATRRGEEVELVPVVPIPGHEREQQYDRSAADREHRAASERCNAKLGVGFD